MRTAEQIAEELLEQFKQTNIRPAEVRMSREEYYTLSMDPNLHVGGLWEFPSIDRQGRLVSTFLGFPVVFEDCLAGVSPDRGGGIESRGSDYGGQGNVPWAIGGSVQR